MQLFKSQRTDVEGGPSVQQNNSSSQKLNPNLNTQDRVSPKVVSREAGVLNKRGDVFKSEQITVVSALGNASRTNQAATSAMVEINGRKFMALIDSGATRSIATKRLAEFLGLNYEMSRENRQWFMADGTNVLNVVGSM